MLRLQRSLQRRSTSWLDFIPFLGDQLYRDRPQFRGRIKGRRFCIGIVKRKYYRTSFGPFFFGSLSPDPVSRGTRIEGYLRMTRPVQVFLTIWFAFAVFDLVIELTYLPDPDRVSHLTRVMRSLFMPAMGVLIVGFGRWLSRNDPAQIAAFLEETLEATQLDAAW